MRSLGRKAGTVRLTPRMELSSIACGLCTEDGRLPDMAFVPNPLPLLDVYRNKGADHLVNLFESNAA